MRLATLARSALALTVLGLASACREPGPAGPRPDAGMDAEAPGCGTTTEEIQGRVLAVSCASAGCHSADMPAIGLDLVSPGLEERIVGAPSATCMGATLVVAGDPDTSFLIDKVSSDTPACGARMPLGGALAPDAIECLRAWIAALPRSDGGPPDGGPPDAGTDAGPARCGPTELECGASCVDPQSDLAHCGACDRACEAGRTCTAGACVCTSGLRECDGACVDVTSDPANCGACGARCGAGEVCSASACRTGGCPIGTTNCGGACVDTATSELHCGGCGAPCAAGETCTGGSCGCSGGLASCSGACVDTTTDESHCGSCTTVCASGQSCAAGTCSCPTATTLCSGACVDTSTDEAHCGSCATTCPAGTTCAGGACGCTGGLRLCGTACADTASDPRNCGSCGMVCAAGTTCTAGSCVGCGPAATLSGQVQPIFTARCATGMCHSGIRPAAGLSLVAGQSHANLVGRPASGCADGRLRVEASRPDRSYLLNKLTGVGMCFGMQMPLIGAPLSSSELALVSSWICRGAMND